MAEVIIKVLVWVVVIGLVVFLAVYASTRPWRHRLGRMQISFMTTLAGAFLYSVLAQFLDRGPRLKGWIIMLGLVAGVVWWQTALLLSYQIKARREANRQEQQRP